MNSDSNMLDSERQALRRKAQGRPGLEFLIDEIAAQRVDISKLSLVILDLQKQLELFAGVIHSRDLLLPSLGADYVGITSLKITPDDLLGPDDGFYNKEYDELGGSFRWTGPGPMFRLDLHVERRSSLQFRLRLQDWGKVGASRLRCFVDGVSISVKCADVGDELNVTGVIPPRLDIGVTEVAFILPQTFKGQPEDPREFGVAFRELTIEPAIASEQPNVSEETVVSEETILMFGQAKTLLG